MKFTYFRDKKGTSNMTTDNHGWASPLPNAMFIVPLGKTHPNAFGAKRRFGFHTGVDLICDESEKVASVEQGTVIDICNLSKNKPQPWINQTRAVLIEGESGVICYGNVKENKNIKVGQQVAKGEIIGKIMPIYKKKRRNNHRLKLEWYKPGTRRRASWLYTKSKPSNLLDPTPMLVPLITKNCYRKKKTINNS